MSQGYSEDFFFGILGPTAIPILVIEGLLHLSLGSDVFHKKTREPMQGCILKGGWEQFQLLVIRGRIISSKDDNKLKQEGLRVF